MLNFQNISLETAVDLWKINAKQIRLGEKDLLDASKIMGSPSPNFVKAFVSFKPSVNSEELISQGFSGKELGQKIKELETEKFQALL